MDRTRNCWEYKNCGRHPSGLRREDLGVCPASTDISFDGVNGGSQAGRVCWAVAGTMCGGEVQGSMAAKLGNCLKCDFYKLVAREEKDFTLFPRLSECV
jgi:hypothetical protein